MIALAKKDRMEFIADYRSLSTPEIKQKWNLSENALRELATKLGIRHTGHRHKLTRAYTKRLKEEI